MKHSTFIVLANDPSESHTSIQHQHRTYISCRQTGG